ncbi:sensor histidine kinase [Microbacterium marinilacus]|uniref:histidine kinase n=1 Tax=Microbacterium marinilacus TaxID=415209 RepID=A0ABP7B4D0_9MICO|nr:sensor histidine kinase [Microbacterium marinilacus]MBY0687964.1 sensor histidine kinase [Microbacterium marinilacus]
MPRIPPRVPPLRAALLDLAAGIGMAGPALMVLHSYDSRPVWMTVTVVLLLAVAVIVWVLWRRSGQRSRTAAVAFAVVATATMALGNGSLFYGIVWAACLVLGVTFARGLVLWAYAAGLVALVVVLHLGAGSSVETTYTEAIGAAVLAGIAAAVGVVLRDSLRVGDALHDALTRLDEANAELRRRIGADRDLVLAHERERTARDLHDDLGHRLTAIGLSLDYAARVDDRDAAQDELARARALVGQTLDAMRRLVRAMHPVELGALRDAEAFHAVADAFRGTGIDIRVSVEGDDAALPREHSLLLLRFVQEGLTNVVRHANATSVRLRVEAGADGVEAVIQDDGGRVAGEDGHAEGFGLRSLRSRAESLGGRFEAGPETDGFRVGIALPRVSTVPAPAGGPA